MMELRRPKNSSTKSTYGSDTILDADDLETIRQCELSIKDFQRQKDAYLPVMNPQPTTTINDGAPEERVEEYAPSLTKRGIDQQKKIPVQTKRHLDLISVMLRENHINDETAQIHLWILAPIHGIKIYLSQ